jgi:murein DD-endopeptidase MepM/ murein hydrolase activator NlpD
MTRSVVAVVASGVLVGAAMAASRGEPTTTPIELPATSAIGIRLDTLLVGGYAAGSFLVAMTDLASDLSDEERALVGRHLDRIFEDVLPTAGLGTAGRLRVAYERALRPDGTPRSIRVLSAEVAVAGRLHTAYYFDRDGRPEYFDAFGRSLDGGGWTAPLGTMRVSSGFGARRLHPILGRVLPHTGVDLAAPHGEPVMATGDGIVVAAGVQGGYGLLVELQHPNGYSTRYAHLSALAPGIERARVVRQGEPIGFVGMTGLATGPHLHYEVRRRDQPVDPLAVATEARLTGDLGENSRWTAERRALGNLLARTPTTNRPPGTGATVLR